MNSGAQQPCMCCISIYCSNPSFSSYKQSSFAFWHSYLTFLSFPFLICPKHGIFFLWDFDHKVSEEWICRNRTWFWYIRDSNGIRHAQLPSSTSSLLPSPDCSTQTPSLLESPVVRERAQNWGWGLSFWRIQFSAPPKLETSLSGGPMGQPSCVFLYLPACLCSEQFPQQKCRQACFCCFSI